MVIELESSDGVAVLRWRDGENRFNATAISRWNEVLDELEHLDGPLALVCVGDGRIWSNGLDLEWLSSAGDAGATLVPDLHRLFARLMTFPAFTVAAINGHAFAAGAMLSMAFDARIMRSDHGWWCLPEVDLGLPLTPEMMATVAAKLPQRTLHEATVTARRYTASEALAAGIVDEIAPEDRVLERAVELAHHQSTKDRRVIGIHKTMLYAEVTEVCTRAE